MRAEVRQLRGGVVHQPSDKTLGEARKWAPGLPLDRFVRALSDFEFERHHHAEPPRDVADKLQEISAAARRLYDLLANRSAELNDYLGAECALFGDGLLPETLEPVLLRLSGLAGKAHTEAEADVPASRSLAPLTRFILALARDLQDAGEPVSGSANGPLVKVVEAGLRDISYNVGNTASTVSKALKAHWKHGAENT